MKLSEIFYSIQGESTYMGLPCIFVRLSGCNLRCTYCDTKYAYKERFSLNVRDTIKEIKKLNPVKLVEITGGEPLLQDEVYELMKELLKKDYQILLETNGSILVNKVPKEVIKIMDIKTPSSKMSEKMKWENIDYLFAYDEIKFVIANKTDFDWAIGKIKLYDLTRFAVLLSPVYKKLELKQLSNWILKSEKPIRMQVQLHKIIWNNINN